VYVKKLVKRNDKAIQCDGCDLWVHARCENISKKDYDKLVKAEQSDWFCTNCSAQCYLCNKQVKPNDPAVQCDNCNNWIHNKCSGIKSEEYKELQTSSATWICPTCDAMNFSDSFFENSNSIQTANKFEALNDQKNNIKPSIVPPNNNHRLTHSKIKLMSININGIRGKKKLELPSFLEIEDPYIIAIQETKIDRNIFTSELFPDNFNYDVYRNDRTLNGGGE
jgi:hypothetical protein